MKYDIFISYRRIGGRDIARTIQQALIGLGFNREAIFFDYNSLRDGVFNEKIVDAINECNDFVLVLSKGSMDRCANDGDWVAREILTAINAGCKIIPIRIDNEFIDFPDNFPKNLGVLRNIQATTLHTDEYFDDSIRHISERFVTKPTVLVDKAVLEVEINADETCEVFLNGEHKHKVKGKKPVKVHYFTPGEHYDLVFKSLARKDFEIKIQYDAPLGVVNDTLDISFVKEAEDRKNKEIENQKEQQAKRALQELAERKRHSFLSKYQDHSDTLVYDRQLVENKDELFGYINEAGHECIPCQYLAATDFIEGYAYVKQESGWGIINVDNEVVLPCVYDTCHSIVNGFAIVEQNHRYRLYEMSQKFLRPEVFDEILPVMVKTQDGGDRFSGVMLVKEREEYRFYPVSSKASVPTIRFTSVNKYLYNHTVLPSNNVYNKRGTREDCLQYCFLPDYFQSKGKYGIVNADFKVVVPFVYDEIRDTDYDNRHIIIRNHLFGLVDSDTGEILIDVEHGAILVNEGYGNFLEVHDNGQDISSADVFRYINGKIGVYDYSGNMVVPQMYDAVFFEDGVIVAKQYKDPARKVVQTDSYSFSGELQKTESSGNIEEERNRAALQEPDWSGISVNDAWFDKYYMKYEYISNENKLESLSEAPKDISVLGTVMSFMNELRDLFCQYSELCDRMGIQQLTIPDVPEKANDIKQYPIKNYLSLKHQAARMVIHFFANQTVVPGNIVKEYLQSSNSQRMDMTWEGPLHDILKEDEWVAETLRFRSLEKDFLFFYACALSTFENIVESL